jgi:nitrogen regulatory protein P-II 1
LKKIEGGNSMLSTFKNISIISIIHPRGAALSVIEAARSAGALFGTITAARGFTLSKRRFFGKLTVSPAMEKIMLYAENSNAENVIHTCVNETGIALDSFGAVTSSVPVTLHALPESIVHNQSPRLFTGDKYMLQENLRNITCICQRGKADAIARAAVNAGSTAPVIFYGEGQGIREKLGLLRIAVNPEKEIISVVAGEMESFHIFDAMVDAGSLYTPGMGFIYVTDIPAGYVNLQSTLSDSHTEATVEQIVKAIDDLKGTKNWRLSKGGFSSTKRAERPSLYNLINLKIITRRGLGDEFVGAALAKGARGASRYYANLIGSEKVRSITGIPINDEREIIDFNLTREMADSLLQDFNPIIKQSESYNTFILEMNVPKALTYISS